MFASRSLSLPPLGMYSDRITAKRPQSFHSVASDERLFGVSFLFIRTGFSLLSYLSYNSSLHISTCFEQFVDISTSLLDLSP